MKMDARADDSDLDENKEVEQKDFFHNLAKVLTFNNIIPVKNSSAKQLRLLCHEYMQKMEKGDEKSNWVKQLMNTEKEQGYKECLQWVQYTPKEMEEKSLSGCIDECFKRIFR